MRDVFAIQHKTGARASELLGQLLIDESQNQQTTRLTNNNATPRGREWVVSFVLALRTKWQQRTPQRTRARAHGNHEA